jgi:hypothetical protein
MPGGKRDSLARMIDTTLIGVNGLNCRQMMFIPQVNGLQDCQYGALFVMESDELMIPSRVYTFDQCMRDSGNHTHEIQF